MASNTPERFFALTRVHRNDLRGALSRKQIARLTDADLEEIRARMATSVVACSDYWYLLECFAREVLRRKATV